MTSLLETRQLQVEIGDTLVCRDLDFSLQTGECVAVLGRNGAGKSTLLSVLAGLRQPMRGEVCLHGASYQALGHRTAALLRGWLPQYHADPFASTVLEAVLAGRHPHLGRWQWESADDLSIARAALRTMTLAGMEERQVHSLSGGERQRLAISTLLTQAPQLYLLDEPLTHLDLNHQIAVLELFRAQARDAARGCAMVLHDPGLAARYCARALLLLGDGEWIAGPVDEVINTGTLTRLYGHPLREVRDGAARWFVPA